jgi:hypothetical protein
MSEEKKDDGGLGELIARMTEARKKFEEEHGELVLADDFVYPLKVEKILATGLGTQRHRPDIGQLVKVRPVSGEGRDKTFLGILLGDLLVGVELAMTTKSSALMVQGMRNPAIYVPALRRVVWGRGSFWAAVTKEDDLSKLITDELIAETWYVKAAKKMFGLDPEEMKKEADDE